MLHFLKILRLLWKKEYNIPGPCGTGCSRLDYITVEGKGILQLKNTHLFYMLLSRCAPFYSKKFELELTLNVLQNKHSYNCILFCFFRNASIRTYTLCGKMTFLVSYFAKNISNLRIIKNRTYK